MAATQFPVYRRIPSLYTFRNPEFSTCMSALFGAAENYFTDAMRAPGPSRNL